MDDVTKNMVPGIIGVPINADLGRYLGAPVTGTGESFDFSSPRSLTSYRPGNAGHCPTRVRWSSSCSCWPLYQFTT